jgi:hypothetical protein
MISGLNRKIVLDEGEEWPKKRNPEYEKFLRGWARYSATDILPPREIDCDIRDVVSPGLKEIRSKYGEPRNLYIPNRFGPNFFSSESIRSSYMGRQLCGTYSESFIYLGMYFFSHRGEELYIEYLPGDDMSKYIANFDA